MMKKFTLVIIIACFSLSGFSQDWRYSNYLIGTENISVIKSINDIDNNTIVFGYYTGTLQPRGLSEITSRGVTDYFIAKFDSLKNLLWVNSIGSASFEAVLGGAVAGPDKSIYVTGGFQGDFYYTDTDFLTSAGNHDVFLAKFDEDGNNIWCRNVGSGNKFQRATTLNIDKQGFLLLGAFYQDSIKINEDTTLYTNAFKDYMYGKFDSGTGDLVWAKALESIDSNFSGFTYSFAPAEDHYIITGVFADSVRIQTDTIVSESVNYYDVHIFKTNLNGDVQWIRKVQGNLHDYSYNSTIDPENNIYITGYFASTEGLKFDSTETLTSIHTEKFGDYDFFIAKYSTEGILQWVKVNGGTEEDRLLNSNFIDGRLWVTGYFADTMYWGAQMLTTAGKNDVDMFFGSIDPEGNYTGATQFSGINNSREEGLSVFGDTTSLNVAMRTNSFTFDAGDSTYKNPSEVFFIVVGNVGCLPILVEEDLDKHIDIEGCFGNSTGQIGINASGGFGDFKYSIGDNYPYQASPIFPGIPAGDEYQLRVLDSKGCYGSGPTVTITQPEELIVNSVDSTDVLCFGESTGTISVDAAGGTGTLTYSINGGVTYPYIAGTDVANVAAGTYEIAVKDDNNCVKMPGTATILEPEALTLDTISTTDPLCFGDATGEIVLTAAGGVEPYEYSSDGGAYQSEATLGSLAEATYSPAVRDANNCITVSEIDVVIDAPEQLKITLESSSDITDEAVGEIVVTASGGIDPYVFSLNPSAGTQDPVGVFTFVAGEGGDYVVELDDANSCGPVSTSAITIADLTSINDRNQLNASIYPNPSSGMVTVEFTTDKQEMTLEIFSIDGRSVMRRQVYSAGGQVRETLDLSGLDKGMYMLRVDQQTLSSGVVLK
ncbi:MAG: T9SS type A sorting domain-containing protein [Bacteroidales bacterium]|nr:T9SS type A sorting domain-containing protein [Bacteroidales bacterium]